MPKTSKIFNKIQITEKTTLLFFNILYLNNHFEKEKIFIK